jgi:pimeloyl-ACP methyl ester carboxylesterase
MKKTADGRIAYGDEGQGPPLVLLHAFPLDSAMWRPQVEALRATYRVLTPDMPGFGGSAPFAGPPSIDTMADAVAGLLDELRIERVVLAGLSMGGYAALAFARRHAARLNGLLLADTRAEPDSEEAKANRNKLIAFARTATALDVFEQLLPKMVSDETRSRRPEVVDEARRIAARQSVGGIVAALEALRDRADAGPVLRTIAVPTLVIVGRDDVLTPPAVAEKLRDGITGARLVVLDGAGHLSNLERPEAFTAALGEPGA